MNPTEIETTEVKRGLGRPRKINPETTPPELKKILPGFNETGLGQVVLDPPQITIENCRPNEHPKQSLGDLYSAIDAAPVEWMPSLLAKVVRRSLKSGAWSSVEHLILSVRGFSK